MEKKDGEIIVTEKKLVHAGKYLHLYEYFYENTRTKAKGCCETIVRNTKQTVSGVKVIPIAVSKSRGTKEVVLNVAYRVPVERYVLEFPAGLKGSETIEECAVRELKEETGYVGQIVPDSTLASVLAYTDPWKGSGNTQVLIAHIDLDIEANRHPEQELEEAEQIRRVLLPFESFYESVLKYISDTKYLLHTSVWMFATGLNIARLPHITS